MQVRIINISRRQAQIFQFALENHHLEEISYCNCQDIDDEDHRNHQVLLMDPKCYRAIDAIIDGQYSVKIDKDLRAGRTTERQWYSLKNTAHRLRRDITAHMDYLEEYAEWRIERD